jgi:hydrogenase maturation protease
MPVNTLLIGIGGDFRRDDSVGLVVARELRSSGIERVDVVEHDGEATSLLDAWEHAPQVVLVDAVRSGAPPGTILRLDGHNARLADRRTWYSSHALGLAEAVTLAMTLGRLPPSLVVYGIEGEDFGVGTGLSPAVARAARDLVLQLIGGLATERNPSA